MVDKPQLIQGINIQWPWSRLLLSRSKTIETRSYPLPKKYLNQELALVETPGPKGKKEGGIEEASVIAIICFSSCRRYLNRKDWEEDLKRHRVNADDPLFAFKSDKPKYAWKVKYVIPLAQPVLPPKPRGIIFTGTCSIPKSLLRNDQT